MRLKIPQVLIFILVLLLAGLAHARLNADYRFEDLDGKIYTPDSLRGSPVVVYVGSTF